MSIKLLDCTLRDGGYINDWNFGCDTIKNIVSDLTEAKIDIIELGFMKSVEYDENRTLFETISDFEKFIPLNRNNSKYYGMIKFGEYDIKKLDNKKDSSIDGIRVIFRKEQKKEALKFCREVKNKGFELFINPTYIDQFSKDEILEIIEEINDINPNGFSIVDTMGVIDVRQLLKIFDTINENLSPGIKICLHMHNNLQQSFMCASNLIEHNKKRDLIIDVSVMGMGRCAGNLNAGLMISYLNDYYNACYDLNPILNIADNCISKIYDTNPWGYSIPYFLSATAKCHPKYASYLMDKKNISTKDLYSILKQIPKDKKANYDTEIIEKLYLNSISS